MTQALWFHLVERAQQALSADGDHMVATDAYDLAWLVAQSACWPVRVDPDRTTNDRFCRLSSAATMLAQATELTTLREQIAAVRHVIEQGYPTPAKKTDKCQHDKFGWEDCIACYDEALLSALSSTKG